MAIAIGQITIIDVLDGEQGPQGVAGPAGTPGFLGLLVNGSTLSLKGYDADGELQSPVGYIYIDGNRYPVPEYSETFVNGGGQGYILFNESWASPVRFAKMIVDNESIVYKDFETLAVLGYSAYVVGQFFRDQVIYDYKIINPQSTKNFEKSNFMEILSNSDVVTSEINSWASALGVTQVFQKIAVLEALVGSLIAGKIRVGGGSEEAGFLFKAEVVNGNAVISAYFEGDRVFHIDGNTGGVEMAGTGKFLGLIESEPLVTQRYEGGGSISSSPSKSLWSTDELYSELTTIPESENIQSASGSYGGKTINGVTRLASSGEKAVISNYANATEISIFSSTAGEKMLVCGKVEAFSGGSLVNASFTGYKDRSYESVMCYLYYSFNNYSLGQIFIPSSLFSGTRISGSYDATLSTTSKDFAISGTNIPTGPYVYLVMYIGDRDDGDPAMYGFMSNINMTLYSNIVGKGVFLRYTDDTYALIAENQRRNDVLSLTSPAWATSGNINYISGTDFYNSFASLALGISTPCSGSLNINGTPYSPLYVSKQADSIKFQMSNDVKFVYKWGGQGSLLGVYTSLSCSLTIIGQLSAVKFNNLISLVTNGGTIGQGSNRVNAYFGTNMDVTMINSAGTSNNVYGAVFN